MSDHETMEPAPDFESFEDFYQFYLDQHQDPVCRAFHYVGSLAVIGVLAVALIARQWRLLFLLPVVGYGMAWIGHWAFEKNRPATFKYPVYSFIGDWVMLKDFLLGRLRRPNR